MSRPRKLDSPTTSIQVTWDQKDRMSVYRKDKEPTPGHKLRRQTDPELVEMILSFYEKAHPVRNPIPKSTIPNDGTRTPKISKKKQK